MEEGKIGKKRINWTFQSAATYLIIGAFPLGSRYFSSIGVGSSSYLVIIHAMGPLATHRFSTFITAEKALHHITHFISAIQNSMHLRTYMYDNKWYGELRYTCTIDYKHIEPIIKSVDSLSRDEPDSSLTQCITNAGISRARYTITHFKHHHRVLRLISN